MHYRAEIDGLRALAVVPVILFHAGFHAFSGGFIGVDVFFVISGYLITSIIINDLAKGQFSLVDFYVRRAKRILPALFLVMLVCLPFAAFIFLPIAMKDFAQSLVATSVFSSNFLFFTESGYFEPNAELKPLLHTWSLAVEEQYYIIFPLLLILAWRFGRRWILGLLTVIFLFSLAAAEWGTVSSPAAAFYLLPMRAWELLIGAFAAFYLQDRAARLPHAVHQAGSVMGLALIFYAIAAFDEATPFPGVQALIPTLGTTLIILFAMPGTWVNRLLSVRALVFLGLMSYCAYLWHQPLFAFSRYSSPEEPSAVIMLLLCFATLPLAYLSWRFVERPFRRPELPAGTLISVVAVAAVGFIGVGYAGSLSDGFKNQILTYRLSDNERHLYETIRLSNEDDPANTADGSGQCHFRASRADALDREKFQKCADQHGPAVVILGDSHAINIHNIVAGTGSLPFLVGITQGGCRVHGRRKPTCGYGALEAFLSQQRHLIKKIVYHQSGSYFVNDRHGKPDSQRAFTGDDYSFSSETIAAAASYLSALRERHDLDVTWLGPFLEYRHRPRDVLTSETYMRVNPNSVRIFLELEPVIKEIVSKFPNILYTSFADIYDVPLHAFAGDCFLFRDIDHFSRCGEDLISQDPDVIDFARSL